MYIFFYNLSLIVSPIFYKVLYMSIIASIIGILIIIIKKIFYKNTYISSIMFMWLIFIVLALIPVTLNIKFNINNFLPLRNIENISYSYNSNNYIDNDSKITTQAGTNENYNNNSLLNNNNKLNVVSEQNSKADLKYLTLNIIIPLVWLIIFFSILIFYIYSYIKFSYKLGKKYIDYTNIIKIFNDVKHKLRIRKNIKLVEQDLVHTPSIFGIFNIRILLNKNIYSMPEKQISYIFLHELSHYIKRHYAINVLILLVQSIHWFNPLIMHLSKELRDDIEIYTDNFVVNGINNGEYKDYCRTLLSVANLENDKFILPKFLCISDNKKDLERRIKMMKISKIFSKKKVVFSILVIFIIIILSSFIIDNKINDSRDTKNNTLQYTFNNPILPEGFKKVETTSASWQLENGIPKGWNNGLVIEDDKGNQFVWVPVDINNLSYSDLFTDIYGQIYKTYNKNSMDSNVLEDNQILKYGGFYIARYEAGVNDDMQKINTNITIQTNDIEGIPVSKKGIRPWDFISLKNAKINAQSMYNTNYLESDLITDKQWVTIMQWIANSGVDVSNDSSSWGNYSNVNFKFSGLYSEDYGKNYKYGKNKDKTTYNMILSSGATDRNMKKNIYDLAGNLLEYTDEYTTNNGGGYLCAGGHFDTTGKYNASTMTLINTKPLEKVGFRVVLYEK